MLNQIKPKIQIIRVTTILLIGLLLTFIACAIPPITTPASEHTPTLAYDRFNNPNWEFNMDYPKGWAYQPEQKEYSGTIETSKASFSVFSDNDSYDTWFNIFNSPKDVAKLEYKDKTNNNILYSTFTQVVNNLFTRIYVCKLNAGITVILGVSIGDSEPQANKDMLEACSLHMVGSLTTSGAKTE